MADIQLYTGELGDYFSVDQLHLLKEPIDKRLISTRKGGGGTLKYIEGHDAIDQANRIFGYGNWAHRALSVEQVVILDPLTGEAVGVEYKALVELAVRGASSPTIEVGSQPVATWNVQDQIMQRRIKAAQYNKTKVDESAFTMIETREARAVIMESHEAAKKGAVTDGMKRCLRAYGDQFGNSLYGDGHLNLDEGKPNNTAPGHAQQENRVVDAKPVQQGNRPADAKPSQSKDTTPVSIQSEGLARQLTTARTRAYRLGIMSGDWLDLVLNVTGKESEEAVTLDDLPVLNGELTKREQEANKAKAS